jgi:hypothetical protein
LGQDKSIKIARNGTAGVPAKSPLGRGKNMQKMGHSGKNKTDGKTGKTDTIFMVKTLEYYVAFSIFQQR